MLGLIDLQSLILMIKVSRNTKIDTPKLIPKVSAKIKTADILKNDHRSSKHLLLYQKDISKDEITPSITNSVLSRFNLLAVSR